MSEKNIYPSNLRNYFLKDTLLDYLNMYVDPSLKDVSTFPEADFTKLMFDLGNEYESNIVAKLISLCNKLDLTYYQVDRNSKETPYSQTKTAFQLRVDIIFQPFLKDWSTNIAGYPDIIISKHAYKKLFHENLITVDKFSDQSYFVIDVKYSTLTAQETDYQRFIRAQVKIYNTLLTTVLNGLKILTKPSPTVAFILGKGDGELGKLTMLQLDDNQLNKDIYDAIQWVNKVRKEGKNWDINSQQPFDRQTQTVLKELFPNMGNKYDYPWHSYKTVLAERFKDISYVWGIGTKTRTTLRENDVIDFEDTMLNDELANIINTDTQKYKNISQIVSNLLDSPLEGREEYSLKNIDKRKFIYFDIEGCYEFKMFEKGRQYITMIGFGQYIHKNNKKMDLETNWVQKTFFIDKLVQQDEEKMITDAINYLKIEQVDSEIILLHYTSAENQFLKMLRERGVIFKSVDLAVCFKYFWEKGVIELTINNFRLKTLMQQFLEMGYLDIDIYKESKIKSGMEVAAIYNRIKNLEINYKMDLIQEIIKYNESDCKSLYIIHLLVKTKVSL